MRDRILAGDVTLASIISVMSFNNKLVEVCLTGEQLDPGKIYFIAGEESPGSL